MNKLAKLLLTICIAAVTFTVHPAANAQQDRFSEVDSEIARLMALYDVPGVGLAVVEGDKVVYSKGYGVRSTVGKAPVTDKTAFGLGSVTKSLTALGVQLLVNEGKLDLDKPVITYIPDLKLSDAEAQKTLTLRQLMSHTSGLSPADTGTQVLVSSSVNRAQFIESLAKIPLVAKPGQAFYYANQNFVLAGLAIEKVTGQTWEDFVAQRIYKPLGMTNASFDEAGLKASADAAEPHDLDVLQGMIPVPYTQNLSAIGPAGSANASALDWANFLLFQLNGKSGSLSLPMKLVDEMHTPVIRIGGAATSETVPQTAAQATAQATAQTTSAATAVATTAAEPPIVTDTSYALGWFTQGYRGLNLVYHGGNVAGYSSAQTIIPEKKLGYVLLVNANYANSFLDVARLRLADILTGLKPDGDLAATVNRLSGFDPEAQRKLLETARSYKADPAALDAFTGEYNGASGKVTVAVKDGKLSVNIVATGNAIELIPYAENAFLGNTFPVNAVRFTFEKSASGISIKQGDPKAGIVVAFKAAAGITTKEVKDPDGRYSVTIPAALAVQSVQGLNVIQQASPAVVLVLASYELKTDDALADFEAFTRQFDPNFKDKPSRTATVAINGKEWTYLEYAGPSGQISANYILKQDKRYYYVAAQYASTDANAADALLQPILNSFTVTAK